MCQAVEGLSQSVGVAQACRVLGVSRASYYRWVRSTFPGSSIAGNVGAAHPRALTGEQRQEVRDILNSERFRDMSPRQVYATLLDDGIYLCDWGTMYRILRDHNEVRERRRGHKRKQYKKPELLATGVNQLWTWDITKLKGPRTWLYFYLYVVIDVFSRYVVGWMLADRECQHLASQLLSESCHKQCIEEGKLTIHSDNGPAMKSKTVAQMLVSLGVAKSHSRPYVSNDNPFSEAQFKTVKYHPSFPERFGGEEEAWEFCRGFFEWYNCEHYHSGMNLLRPHDVHYGLAEEILERRQTVLDQAYVRNPERFVRGRPSAGQLPEAVWINPPKGEQTKQSSPESEDSDRP